ncbi:hypothetical protein BR93DRAFT_401719 [Coniochaeta sp. PMI_546]|nr:hypothetical protein BR93DRAFT_401719 [Coniochaeta sp. PMI_546]
MKARLSRPLTKVWTLWTSSGGTGGAVASRTSICVLRSQEFELPGVPKYNQHHYTLEPSQRSMPRLSIWLSFEILGFYTCTCAVDCVSRDAMSLSLLCAGHRSPWQARNVP